MQIYFSPLACSLASRIAVYEAGLEAAFVEVDPKTKRTLDGADFRSLNPLALVPTLVTDSGEVLSENAAILQHLGEPAGLVPAAPFERARLREWLSFIGTELHKALYLPLLDARAPEGAKAYALSKATSRLSSLAARLQGRSFCLESFSVADAYLFAVLNWSRVTPVDLSPWPAILAWQHRLRERPGVARALAEEEALYARELSRRPPAADAFDAQALADRYVAVWNEPDPRQRKEQVAALWTPRGAHFAQALAVRGHEALAERVRGSHERNVRDRGYRFHALQNAARLRDLVHFGWEMRAAGQPVARGSGALILDGEGLISVDYLFFDAA